MVVFLAGSRSLVDCLSFACCVSSVILTDFKNSRNWRLPGPQAVSSCVCLSCERFWSHLGLFFHKAQTLNGSRNGWAYESSWRVVSPRQWRCDLSPARVSCGQRGVWPAPLPLPRCPLQGAPRPSPLAARTVCSAQRGSWGA